MSTSFANKHALSKPTVHNKNGLVGAANSGMKRKAHQLSARLSTDPASISRMQKLLLLLRHASKCTTDSLNGRQEVKCRVHSHCGSMKKLWKHVSNCRHNGAANDGKSCSYPNCNRSRYALWHFKNCADGSVCPVCGPVKMMMAKQAADQDAECSRAVSDSQSQNDLENASASCKRQKIDEGGTGVIVELSESSMSSQITYEKCTSILRFLLMHEHAWVFSEPVDPDLLNIPDYFDVIHNPMDLGTIEQRLLGRKYRTVEAFKSDIILTFENALQYNQDGTEVHKMANELKAACLHEFCQVFSSDLC